jgi:hypothetical protein
LETLPSADFTTGRPCPASAGTSFFDGPADAPAQQRYFQAARALRDAGVSALPACDKRPALPSWKAYQGRRPTEGELRGWRDRGLFRGVGVVIPAGSVAFDADNRFAQEAAETLGLRPTVITPSRGSHFYLRGDMATTNLRPAIAGELRGAGAFVMTPPTLGYTMTAPVTLADAWPDFPAARPDLADALRAALVKVELRHYAAMLRGLHMRDGRGVAECPLHEDDRPSLGLYRADRLGGRWAWRCCAECFDSGPWHGGDLSDLYRLLHRTARASLGDDGRLYAGAWDALLRRLLARDLPADVAAGLLAVAEIGRERDLDPQRPFHLSYRVFQAHLQRPCCLEAVKDRLQQLADRGLAEVRTGRGGPDPKRWRTTTVRMTD